MIKNSAHLRDVREQWRAVQVLRDKSEPSRLIPGLGYMQNAVPSGFYNLPMVLAFAVLDQVMTYLIKEGHFACREFELGNKMKASKRALRWQNYSLVELLKKKRNELAHKSVLASKADCVAAINAIEAELLAWGILQD